MSTLKTTNIQHASAASANIVLDSSNNVTTANNLTAGGTLACTGNLTVTSGNVILSNGNGIDFSATSGTGTSELFDDYEEGTWTPTVAPGSGSGQSVSVRGEYIKIGKQVTLWGEVIVNSVGTASGGMEITGLPFNVVANDRAVGVARNRSTVLATMGSVFSPQNNKLWLVEYDGTTPWFAVSYWLFSVSYEV